MSSNKISARSYRHLKNMLTIVESPLEHPYVLNEDGILVNEKLGKIRLFNLQKFNKKSKQEQVVENGKNITKSTMIRKTPMWVCRYHDFPISMLGSSTQHLRNFSLDGE